MRGPLIKVLQFVGFMAALRVAGGEQPLLAATLDALLANWVLFTPCLAWIFLNAAFMNLRQNRGLTGALRAVTVTVVGGHPEPCLVTCHPPDLGPATVIEAGPLGTGLPVLSSLDPAAAVLSALALVAVIRWRIGMVRLLAGAASTGIVLHLSALTGCPPLRVHHRPASLCHANRWGVPSGTERRQPTHRT